MPLLVMGHDCRCQRDDCKRISVPAFDAQQQPVIIAVTAHQMSDHRISFAPASIKQVTVEQTIVSAFAIYKDELDEIQWNRMKQAPVRTTLEFFQDGDAILRGTPWRRMWTKNSKAVPWSQAETFGFLARLSRIGLEKVLKQSGHNHVYLHPLQTPSEKEVEFVVIWMESESKRENAILLAKQCDAQMGLVRSRKGMGIRVLRTDHKKVWQQLRPGEQEPEVRSGRVLFKVQPLPKGLTMDNIREWIKMIQWEDATVVRSLGPTAWMIAAKSAPADEFQMFNEGPVLIKPLQTREPGATPQILAGMTKQEPQRQDDPLWVNDPWMKSLGRSSVPTQSATVASGSQAQGPAVTKLEQKVQAQNKQITAMQQRLETVTHTQAQMLGEQKQIRGDFREMATKTQEELDKVSKGFEATMMKLNAKQDAQMTRGFDELRQLILNMQKTDGRDKRQRRDKDTGREDMMSD